MKFMFNGVEYYINHRLASQLDNLIYNIKNDWDFVLLITGDRTVRVGKSVLGMAVCAYLSYRLQQLVNNKVLKMEKGQTFRPYSIDDIYFDNAVMMSEALGKPKYSINHFDEAREGLAASKGLKQFQKDLMDFFAECGQLNQLFVIVLPDFFELKEEIAVPRSELLINVFRKATLVNIDFFKTGKPQDLVRFDRGNFEFFCRRKKKTLYDKYRTTHRKDYFGTKADFIGSFTNQYPIPELDYKKKKKDSLSRFKERHAAANEKHAKTDVFRDRIIMEKHAEGWSGPKIAEFLRNEWDYGIEDGSISRIIKRKNEERNDI